MDDQPKEEAVMQISGAGHWFLEAWIGDHAVDFLVDSGSAVTPMSGVFYKTLMGAGEAAWCQRLTDRHPGVLILRGLVSRAPGGVPYFGV